MDEPPLRFSSEVFLFTAGAPSPSPANCRAFCSKPAMPLFVSGAWVHSLSDSDLACSSETQVHIKSCCCRSVQSFRIKIFFFSFFFFENVEGHWGFVKADWLVGVTVSQKTVGLETRNHSRSEIRMHLTRKHQPLIQQIVD